MAEEQEVKKETEQPKSFTEQLKSAVVSKITAAVTGIILLITGIITNYLNASLEVILGKPESVSEKSVQIEESSPLTKGGVVDVRSILKDQYELRDANWTEIFRRHQNITITLEDYWWCKEIKLPDSAAPGSEFSITRTSLYTSFVLYGENKIEIQKGVKYLFLKTQSGWKRLS